jgi:hypothetical protein
MLVAVPTVKDDVAIQIGAANEPKVINKLPDVPADKNAVVPVPL